MASDVSEIPEYTGDSEDAAVLGGQRHAMAAPRDEAIVSRTQLYRKREFTMFTRLAQGTSALEGTLSTPLSW